MQLILQFITYFRFALVGIVAYPLLRRFSPGLARAVLVVTLAVQLLAVALDILI